MQQWRNATSGRQRRLEPLDHGYSQRCSAAIETVVEECVKLTKSLPDAVNNERSAVASGDRRHFATWVRLGELLAVWEACHELNRVMWRAGWVAGPSHLRDRAGASVFVAYQVPHRLATIPRGTPRERHLAAAAAVGAEPALIDWETAVQRWERLDRRNRPYIHQEVVQTHDSMGNVLSESKSPPVASEFPPVPAG